MPLPKILIQRPPTTPAKFGILTAADVRDMTDPHTAAGVQWEPDFCGSVNQTAAACYLPLNVGAISVNPDDQDVALNWSNGIPGDAYSDPDAGAGVYTVDWGDGDPTEPFTGDEIDQGDAQHTYAAPGDYTITVTGPHGYTSTVTVTTPSTDQVLGTVTAADPTPKGDTDGRPLVESFPFVLYLLHTCRLVGDNDAQGYAERAMQLAEGDAIGGLLVEQLAEDPNLDNATGLTTVTARIGRAEDQVRNNSNGIGTLVMSPSEATAAFAAFLLVADGDKLRTNLGTLVAIVPNLGTELVYSTGAVVVTRNPVFVSDRTLVTPYDNQYELLVERPISVGYECFAGRVTS